MNIHDLRALVIARNRHVDEEVDRDLSDVPPKALGDNRSGKDMEKSPKTLVGRAIIPLRKSRFQHQIARPDFDTAQFPSMLSTIVMGESARPALINFIRIENCPSITREETSTLKGLGVLDVVCSSE